MLNPDEVYYNVTARQVDWAVDYPVGTITMGLQHFTEYNVDNESISPIYTVTYEQAMTAYEMSSIGMASLSITALDEYLAKYHESNIYT
jgi:hypothetical protein